MTCRQCGTEIAEKALICFRCGTPTTDPQFKPARPSARRRWSRRVLALIVLALLIVLVTIFLIFGRSGSAPSSGGPSADDRLRDAFMRVQEARVADRPSRSSSADYGVVPDR